jgi:hypothetical protein
VRGQEVEGHTQEALVGHPIRQDSRWQVDTQNPAVGPLEEVPLEEVHPSRPERWEEVHPSRPERWEVEQWAVGRWEERSVLYPASGTLLCRLLSA